MTSFYKGFRTINFKIGIFSLGIILLFIVSYAWLTNRLNNQNRQQLEILFDDISGLEIGDKVSYRGMEVGRVGSIQLSGDGILCTIKIHKDITLSQGTAFWVTDGSLMGGKQLMIIPGTGQSLLNLQETQKGDSGPGLMSAISKGVEVIEDVRQILVLVQQEGGLLDKSSRMIDSATGTISSVDSSVEQLEQRLQSTINLVDGTISAINQLVLDNQKDLGVAISQAPPLMQNLSSTIDSLRFLSRDLNTTITRVNQGDGTAGKLLQDQELYDKLLGSVQSLEDLISDVRENPRKYFKFSVF